MAGAATAPRAGIDTDVAVPLALLERADVAVVGVDAEGAVTVWTAGAGRLLGHRPVEALGRSALDLLVPTPRRSAARRLLATLLDGAEHEGDVTAVTADGAPRLVHVRAGPVRDHGGGTTRVLAVVGDAEHRRGALPREGSATAAFRRSLLPRRPPEVEGLELAWRYEPAGADAEPGGDWLDVIPLAAGRTALVAGDVKGGGLGAAVATGQLKAAVRSFAALELPPTEVLRHLDGIVRGLPEARIVTCVYAVYDPGLGSCCIANAGHLPPVLAARGAARTLAAGGGSPLGAGGGEPGQEEVELAAGDVLALYTDGLVDTDGLVEAAGTDPGAGAGALRDALTRAPAHLELAAEQVMRTRRSASGGGHVDDAALLLVRPTADPGGTVVTLTLPPRPSAVSEARSTTAAALRSWGLQPHVDVACLLVSELVTNAVRHAGTRLAVLLRRGGRTLFVEVADFDPRVPRRRHARPDDEGGRGLELVAALAARWGARPTPEGKVVWFELEHEPAGGGR